MINQTSAKWWNCTWSPMVGCHKVSPACKNCWAEVWAKRFHQSFTPHKGVHQNPPRHGQCFMGPVTDIFGDWRDTEDMAGDIIHAAVRGWDADATYIWLTKRVGNMCNALELANQTVRERWLSNHYFGFTAENQEWYDKRIEDFRGGMPLWANGWLSAEPLLGAINLGLQYIAPEDQPFDWVVVGCESGPNRRPCKIEWVESIVEQCMSAKVPVFVKQISINGKCVTDINKFPAHLRIRQVPWSKKGE